MAHLNAHRGGAVSAADSVVETAAGGTTEHPAMFGLLELVGVERCRIVQVVGEVGKQVHAGLDHVGVELEGAVVVAAFGVVRDAVARGLATIGRIDGTEAVDQAAVDGALRDLVGRVPAGRVGHGGDR